MAAALAAVCAVAGLSAPSGADAMELIEPPELLAAVAAGELPPVGQRIPDPVVVAPRRPIASTSTEIRSPDHATLPARLSTWTGS